MSGAPKLPAHYAAARAALAKCRSIEEVKDARDKAIGLEIYAFKAKDRQLLENAAVIKKLAVQELADRHKALRGAKLLAKGTRGQIKGSEPKHSARSGGVLITPPEPQKTLEQYGIDKSLAKQMRAAEAMTPEQREADVAKSARLAVASIEDGKAVIAEARAERHEAKKKKRAERERTLAGKLMALPKKKYGVIVADPEWKFVVWSEKGLSNTSADNHYGTSVLEVIKARDVPSIAADDCALFLWATVPMTPQALEVMSAWGFRYVSHLAWVKNKAGTGYWFRNRHELLLVGTRGNIPAPAEGTQAESVLFADVGKHSAKPEAALEIIERYFPNVPKIELNRRGKPKSGWDAWGLEADNEAA